MVARLENAIDRGYLTIREDRLTHADLGECFGSSGVCVCVLRIIWSVFLCGWMTMCKYVWG